MTTPAPGTGPSQSARDADGDASRTVRTADGSFARGEAAYDGVAELYDRAFADIRVRAAEVAWLDARVYASGMRAPRLLEVGCGTGALLRHLAPRLASGVGVDVSAEMLAHARSRAADMPSLSFVEVTRPGLPFPDNHFDLCVSFLSFRYLDWHRTFAEILRVLRPGGRFLMVDLVSAPLAARDVLAITRSTLRHVLRKRKRAEFARDLAALVRHPEWAAMLARHPMRSRDAYRDFFAEMLPSSRFDTLEVAPGRRIIALDSGPLGA